MNSDVTSLVKKMIKSLINESLLLEKNVPNNPTLWSSCKAEAKRKFDVYPSAYANGFAAKRYKAKGGTWKKAKKVSEDMEMDYSEDGLLGEAKKKVTAA